MTLGQFIYEESHKLRFKFYEQINIKVAPVRKLCKDVSLKATGGCFQTEASTKSSLYSLTGHKLKAAVKYAAEKNDKRFLMFLLERAIALYFLAHSFLSNLYFTQSQDCFKLSTICFVVIICGLSLSVRGDVLTGPRAACEADCLINIYSH